ncbi:MULTISPECIES: flagellar hook-associated protein FlgL [Tepidanaerobacter]|uniref:Flagellar hook-associated protein 3 FlgL n=1 Tax=Tepidanaerobacter syntrophicus TaxID=224999 RepID=A0A0U9HC52_9FIRM|nr:MULTISPECIES: flagellar hook-associated protein FlgL [Tepidanaerobacter]GAQ24373.1 flagellar hook-associated protein 3 FlgL [Tepidanaerobacter syntrophicus]GLI18335.1 flagellar hook-associated protein 3 [Tepidanaerobacter syntrophicus]
MRVTQSMIAENFTRNLMQNLKRLDDINSQISSEKRINRPSDDPVGAAMAIKLRRQLSAIKQYNSNAQQALTWMKDTETALTNAGDVIQRLSELAVEAANGTQTDEDKGKILDEVKELKDQLLKEANSTSLDRYLFSGYSTDKAPFIKDDATGNIQANPDIVDGAINYNVGQSETIPVNLKGSEVFGDIFEAVEKFETALENNDGETISNEVISDIKGALNTVLKYRSQIGARTNRLEATVSRLEANEVDYKAQLSSIEDVDLAQAITDLKMEESVYRAALAVGARIIQPTLVDFLS